MNFGKVASTVILAALPIAGHAAVITFNNPNTNGPNGGNGAAFTSTTENGYTAAVTSGGYIQYINLVPTPAIATGYYNATTDATLAITGPGLFSLASFDAFSDTYTSTITISGFLAGLQVYTSTLAVAVPLNTGTYTTYSGFSSAAVDTVRLVSNAPYRLTLDNITLSAPVADVPEPASWAMMVGGFGLVGGAMRRRQRTAVRFA